MKLNIIHLVAAEYEYKGLRRRNVKKRDFSTELCRDFVPLAVHFLYDMSENITRTTNGRPYGFRAFIQQNDVNFVGTGVLDCPFRYYTLPLSQPYRLTAPLTSGAECVVRFAGLRVHDCPKPSPAGEGFFPSLRHCSSIGEGFVYANCRGDS